ncbi:MAG: hypothetical protein PCFJNLEI_03086 [Verrucomicrobiae bacterium]|nr:hypothetical protein [Verrucomicrobiae bacterium]
MKWRIFHLIALAAAPALMAAGGGQTEVRKPAADAARVGQQALRTDGMPKAIIIPHSSSVNFSTTMSVFVWIKTTDTSHNTGIFAKSNYTQAKRCWGIETWDHGRRLLALLSDNGRTIQSIYGDTVINDGQWHHVGWTYAAGKVELYVDKRMETKTFLTNHRPIPSLNQEAATAVTIGSLLNGDKPTLSIAGTIFRPIAINKALSQAEVDELYDLDFAGSRDPTRLSFWSDVKLSARFSAGSVHDDTANGNQAAFSGGEFQFVDDLPGRSSTGTERPR